MGGDQVDFGNAHAEVTRLSDGGRARLAAAAPHRAKKALDWSGRGARC
jgi:hypothetical protein